MAFRSEYADWCAELKGERTFPWLKILAAAAACVVVAAFVLGVR